MKYALLALLLTSSSQLFASTSKTSYFTVDKVRVSSNTGNLYLDPVENPQHLNSTCSSKSMYAMHKDDEMFHIMYSLALSAAQSKQKVRVWLSTAANDCLSNYQRIKLIEADF